MTTRDLRALVTRIDELGQRSRWPGFDPRTIPLALATGDQTLLVNHPQPPEDFEPISEWPGAYLFPGRYPAMRANTAIALGGTLIAVVLLNRTSRHTRIALATLTIHEMFHVYQRLHHPEWTANEAEDAEHLQLRRLETLALRSALLARTPAAVASWTATAIEIRHGRFAHLPDGARAYERGTEMQEGLATYVEGRGPVVVPATPSTGGLSRRQRARALLCHGTCARRVTRSPGSRMDTRDGRRTIGKPG